MKTKFLLPVLAMIFAVGMSFTTLDKVGDPSTDYILQNGEFEPIDMELDCQQGSATCRVQFEQGGPVYDVYDADDPTSKKEGSTNIIRLWQ